MVRYKNFIALAACFGAIASPMNGFAAQDEECPKELLMSYFPAKFVGVTLSKNNIPADKIELIQKELAEKDKEVVQAVEEKAAKMDPNPLKDPAQRDQAKKIFRETLYDLFAGVLNKNGITDSGQIHTMLDDIQRQKAEQFAKCVEKYQKEAKSTTPAKTPEPTVAPASTTTTSVTTNPTSTSHASPGSKP